MTASKGTSCELGVGDPGLTWTSPAAGPTLASSAAAAPGAGLPVGAGAVPSLAGVGPVGIAGSLSGKFGDVLTPIPDAAAMAFLRCSLSSPSPHFSARAIKDVMISPA